MRILFVTDSLTSGGKERRLTELMKVLKSKQNIEFELAVMNRDIHYDEVYNLGIKIHYIIRRRKKDVLVFYHFYKLCKKYKPDIVHCWDSMSAIYLIPSCKLLNIKFVNGLVVDAPRKGQMAKKYFYRAKLTFPFSTFVIGNSQAGLSAYRVPQKKGVCIYNGFNFERIGNIENQITTRNKYNLKAKYVVLMVGAFEERKDYDTYLAAATLICSKRDDIEFIAVGDGINFSRISGDVAKNKNNNIRLLGKQSDVESIINCSDICVLSTNSKVHSEGISNSILEYMALGKPVIASRGGGTDEIVEDCKTGILIQPLNPGELAEKIQLLINDNNLRNKMGSAGKERIMNYFLIDKMVDRFISVYNNCLLVKGKEKKNSSKELSEQL